VEIKSRLLSCSKQLQGFGPERNGLAEQMAYLVEHATKVQRLVYLAMHASHDADDVFEKNSDPCFAPKVMSRMKVFADETAKYGEGCAYKSEGGEEESEKGFGEGYEEAFSKILVMSLMSQRHSATERKGILTTSSTFYIHGRTRRAHNTARLWTDFSECSRAIADSSWASLTLQSWRR
jgi:hypothetical protein